MAMPSWNSASLIRRSLDFQLRLKFGRRFGVAIFAIILSPEPDNKQVSTGTDGLFE